MPVLRLLDTNEYLATRRIDHTDAARLENISRSVDGEREHTPKRAIARRAEAAIEKRAGWAFWAIEHQFSCRGGPRETHCPLPMLGTFPYIWRFDRATGLVVSNERELATARRCAAFALSHRIIMEPLAALTHEKPRERLAIDTLLPVQGVHSHRLVPQQIIDEAAILAWVRLLPGIGGADQLLPQCPSVDRSHYFRVIPFFDLPDAAVSIDGLLRKMAEQYL